MISIDELAMISDKMRQANSIRPPAEVERKQTLKGFKLMDLIMFAGKHSFQTTCY